MSTDDIRHHGKYIVGGDNRSNRERLRAMKGSMSLLNIGVSANTPLNFALTL